MQAEQIDPRDTSWEVDEPAYRISFWRRQSEKPLTGWVSDEWRVMDVDVAGAMEWARAHAGERRVTIWVEHRNDLGHLGLIRLLGWEPTRAEAPPPWTSLG